MKGIPDDGRVKAAITGRGTLHFSTGGSIGAYGHLVKRMKVREVLLPKKLPDTRPDLIVNEIASPETHSEALRRCAELVERFRCPVVNRPERIVETTRDVVAERLQGTPGLRVPRVFRCKPESPEEVLSLAAAYDLGPEFLIRETGKHGGETLLRIRADAEIRDLHQLAYDGREFYLSEFVDYASPDGLYRKYRVVVVDGQAFLRQVIAASGWMVHAAQRPEMKQHEERMDEERFELKNFRRELKAVIQPIAAAAHQALKLDYFGMDCNFSRDREAVLFEANANMNITRTSREEMLPYVDQPMDALAALIRKRLKTARQQGRLPGSSAKAGRGASRPLANR